MLETTEKGAVLREGALAVLLSSIMYYVGLTNLFFICPLLRFSANHTKKDYLYVALAELGFVVGYSFYMTSGSELFAFGMALNLYIPVSLLAAGMIWVYTSEMKWLKRLFLSFLPGILLTAAIAVYLNADRALFTSLYSRYENVFADLLSTMLVGSELRTDSGALFEILAITVGTMALPVILAAVCASCFFYEKTLHSKESGFDDKVMELELDQNLIWVFLLLFFFFIATYFVSVSLVASMAVTSLFASILLVYAIQGFSVVFVWLRRLNETFRSGTALVFLAFVSIVIPGLNLIVLLGLPAIGVLENFFNLKIRRNK